MAISMLKIRRPLGRLIFNMGIAIPGKTVFLIETAPRLLTVRSTNALHLSQLGRPFCVIPQGGHWWGTTCHFPPLPPQLRESHASHVCQYWKWRTQTTSPLYLPFKPSKYWIKQYSFDCLSQAVDRWHAMNALTITIRLWRHHDPSH